MCVCHVCVCVLYTHAMPIISQIIDREDGGGGRPQGKVGGKLGSYLEDSSPIHTSSCWVLVCSGDSPGSPGLRVGGGRVSPAPRPSLPWRREQVTEGSHRLSRTSCIGKTPSIYRHNMALPGGSGPTQAALLTVHAGAGPGGLLREELPGSAMSCSE